MGELKTQFRTWITEALAPSWLRERRAAELLSTTGLALDALADSARDAVKARFPSLAPTDALGLIGSDRLLDRYSAQSDSAWRAWLVAAWDLWTYAGTASSVERALHEAGFTGATVHWALGDPPPGWVDAWPPDSDTTNWSRFWIWLAEPWPFAWEYTTWGTQQWGGEWTWGSTAKLSEVRCVRSIARKWKPAHTVCAGIYVPFGDGVTLMWNGHE